MTARAILRACAALSLTFALATAPAEASNKRRASEKAGRCAAAHAMAKKGLKGLWNHSPIFANDLAALRWE